VDQYSETNMMQFLFSLLRIKGLYMFRALLAYVQEALHKRHLLYCERVMSVCCYQDWNGTGVVLDCRRAAAIQDRVTAVLRSIPKETFADSFHKLYKRCQPCVEKDGDYFKDQ
jgi:hypothetical protein